MSYPPPTTFLDNIVTSATLNPFPNDEIVNQSKSQAFAGDKNKCESKKEFCVGKYGKHSLSLAPLVYLHCRRKVVL